MTKIDLKEILRLTETELTERAERKGFGDEYAAVKELPLPRWTARKRRNSHKRIFANRCSGR